MVLLIQKQIFLIGTEHHDLKFLPKVIVEINGLHGKVKSIAIEGISFEEAKTINDFMRSGKAVNEKLARAMLGLARVPDFWAEVAMTAAKNGMKIIPLQSKHLQGKLEALKKEEAKGVTSAELQKLVKKTQILAGSLGTELMIRRIKKEKPDAVVVGTFHALSIKEVVPVKSSVLITHRSKEALRRRHSELLRRDSQLALHRSGRKPAKVFRKRR